MKHKYEDNDGTIYPLTEPPTRKQIAIAFTTNIGLVIAVIIAIAFMLGVKF